MTTRGKSDLSHFEFQRNVGALEHNWRHLLSTQRRLAGELDMSSIRLNKIIGIVGAAATVAATPGQLSAQEPERAAHDLRRPRSESVDSSDDAGKTAYSFKSRTDSISWARNKAIAEKSAGYRLVVSLQEHHLWAIVGNDTVLSAPAGTGSGKTLEGNGKRYEFDTPRGIRSILGKEADPIWQPPEWLYVETAQEYDLKLRDLRSGEQIRLSDGRMLTVQGGEVGVIDAGEFAALPTTEHIVFDNTLFVPPMGSKNRKVDGELGKYRLILGDGYLLHGTPFKKSIGLASSHGCVRLRDGDIEWLYENVPVGTKVYIY
jgi:hypothetical protein